MCIRIAERPLESLRESTFLLLLSSRARTRSGTFRRTFHPDPAFESSMGLRAHNASFALSIGISGIRRSMQSITEYERALPLGPGRFKPNASSCQIAFRSRSRRRTLYTPPPPSSEPRDVTITQQRYLNFINVMYFTRHARVSCFIFILLINNSTFFSLFV